jgi:hypothetical protein
VPGGARPNWIFRGQRKATWDLQASALRTEPPPFKDFPNVDPLLLANYIGTPAQKLEMYHVNSFIGLADDLGHHIPGDHPQLRDPRPRLGTMSVGTHLPDIFPPSKLLDMFALAQHYGIPTRLLDWTVKPLIAAYFAAIKIPFPALEDTPRFAVWALERDVVNRCVGCETWLAPREDSIVAFLSAPAATNPNLAAQGGLFTLVQAPDRRDVPSIDADDVADAGGASEILERPSHAARRDLVAELEDLRDPIEWPIEARW